MEETDLIYITLAKNSSDISSSPWTQQKKMENIYEVQIIAPNSPGFYEMSINLLATGLFRLKRIDARTFHS